MTLDQYQQKSYYAIQEHESHKEAMSHWAIGLTEEAGEVNGGIKHKYYNHEYVTDMKMAEELGDVLWYIAALCTELGISLEAVAQLNVAKNQHKYPEGTFDKDRSANRHADYERFQETEEYLKIASLMHVAWARSNVK